MPPVMTRKKPANRAEVGGAFTKVNQAIKASFDRGMLVVFAMPARQSRYNTDTATVELIFRRHRNMRVIGRL